MRKSSATLASAVLLFASTSTCLAAEVNVKSGYLLNLSGFSATQGESRTIDDGKIYIATQGTKLEIPALGTTITFKESLFVSVDESTGTIGLYRSCASELAIMLSHTVAVDVTTTDKAINVAFTNYSYYGTQDITPQMQSFKVSEFTTGSIRRYYGADRNPDMDLVLKLDFKQTLPEGDPFSVGDGSFATTLGKILRANNDLDFEGNPLGLGGSTPLGAVTDPVAAAIAAGSFPVAGALDSFSLSSAGGLTAFSIQGGIDRGTTSTASVCARSACPSPQTIRWGAWANGTVQVSGMPVTVAPTAQLHYLIGNATPPSVIDGKTGTVAFSHLGGTTPTGADGSSYAATVGNLNVNFTAATATLTQYTLAPTLSPSSIRYDFRNVPLTINASTPGDTTKTLFGVATGQAPGATTGSLVVNGFFAGPQGDHVGAALNVTDSANTAVKINSVQAFKQR